MAKGIYRTVDGFVQVDFGNHSTSMPRKRYEDQGYQPPHETLPSEPDYFAAQRNAQNGAAQGWRRITELWLFAIQRANVKFRRSHTELKRILSALRSLIARERVRVLFWTSGGPVEKPALRLMDCEHIRSDHICLSCGKAMRLARTSPEIGEAPELRIYDCKACGVVFTESVGAPEWREN